MGLVHNRPHSWPLPLQPLEHRNFRLLWSASLISNAGSWMQRVATGWLIYSLTGSATWLGIDSLVAGLPTVILLPLGGVIADRLNRRHLLVASNALSAAVALALALSWWTHTLTVWHILAASFISALVASVMVPASQALLPTVVGEDHLPGAIALNSVQYNLARALGPGAGGLALAYGGPGWCFVLNALSYLALVAAFLVIRNIPTPAHHPQPILASLREGLQFLRTRPDLKRMLTLIALLAFCAAPIVTMLPVLAKDLRHQDANTYSLLLTSFGIGAALAGIVLAFQPASKNSLTSIFLAAIVVAAAQAALALVHLLPIALPLVLLSGFAFVGIMIQLGTLLTQHTPDPFRGRISSLQQLLFRTAQPLGGFSVALLTAHSSLPRTLFTCAIILAILTLLIWIREFLRPTFAPGSFASHWPR